MTQNEVFLIVSFRSRQQVMYLDKMLKKQNIKTEIMTTPKSISMGCGLSVKLPLSYLSQAKNIVHTASLTNLIGFYKGERQNGRLSVFPL